MTLVNTEKVLTHWGKKGMRWGVRKATEIVNGPSSPEGVQLRVTPGKPVKAVSGGRAHAPSDDAKAAAAYAQIAKQSSSSALTNKQLTAVITRMRLEQDWQKVVTAEKTKNQTALHKIFSKFKENEINKIAQGKTPNTILLAQAIRNQASPGTGRHLLGNTPKTKGK